MKISREILLQIIQEELRDVIESELQQEGIFDSLMRTEQENAILKVASEILANPNRYSISKTVDMKNYLMKYNKSSSDTRSKLSFSYRPIADRIKKELGKLADKSEVITYDGLQKDIFVLNRMGQLGGMSGDKDFEIVSSSFPKEKEKKEEKISKNKALDLVKPDMVRNVDNLIRKIDRFDKEVLLQNIKVYDKLSKGAITSLDNRLATFRGIDLKDNLENIKAELVTIKQKINSIKRLNEQDIE